MNISIQPAVIALIIIIIINYLLSLGKTNLFKKCYIIISSVFSVAGILGIIIIRPLFISRINKSTTNLYLYFESNFVSDFVSWGIAKFDAFAIISITITCLAIIILLFLLFKNKEKKISFIWSYLTIFVILFKIIVFFASILYSLNTINKFFDIASYISTLSIFEIFVLYIPLVAKRIILLKESILR